MGALFDKPNNNPNIYPESVTGTPKYTSKGNISNPIIYPEMTFTVTDVVDIDLDKTLYCGKPVTNSPTDELLYKLEQDGYDKVAKACQTLPIGATLEEVGDALEGIMKSGAEEFKNKTGRPMTYAEMRSIYG
jgi:hypothetical protein